VQKLVLNRLMALSKVRGGALRLCFIGVISQSVSQSAVAIWVQCRLLTADSYSSLDSVVAHWIRRSI
jgi:hypothetical protein